MKRLAFLFLSLILLPGASFPANLGNFEPSQERGRGHSLYDDDGAGL